MASADNVGRSRRHERRPEQAEMLLIVVAPRRSDRTARALLKFDLTRFGYGRAAGGGNTAALVGAPPRSGGRNVLATISEATRGRRLDAVNARNCGCSQKLEGCKH